MANTILFDLDGTLTDSGEGIMNCAKLALQHFELPIPDEAGLRSFVGPPLHDSFVRFGVPEDRAEEAIAVYRSRYIPIGKFENSPYPGVRELLERLRQEGYTLYVATSKPENTSVEILEHFDLAKYFHKICGAAMDRSRSSKEAVIAYLLETHGTTDGLVMVGDTKFDILGARAHGIPAIGVSWGYGIVEEMEAAGAAGMAHTMAELLALIHTL